MDVTSPPARKKRWCFDSFDEYLPDALLGCATCAIFPANSFLIASVS